MNESQQKAVCDQHGTEFLPPVSGSRVGVAIETLGSQPLNGLRIDPRGGVCGWYLWGGGEPSDADDFYKPLCVEHVADYCPAAISFLALPPGWRFLTDGDYVDVWFDAALTGNPRRPSVQTVVSPHENRARVIDHDETGSMEQKKREGYF